jgi:hypothetical protein
LQGPGGEGQIPVVTYAVRRGAIGARKSSRAAPRARAHARIWAEAIVRSDATRLDWDHLSVVIGRTRTGTSGVLDAVGSRLYNGWFCGLR